MNAQQVFLNRMKQASIVARWKGAMFNEPVMTAQAAAESGWGRSQLAIWYHNILGIKAGGGYEGETVNLPTWEYSPTRGWYREPAWWRVYLSWNECIVDYAAMLADRPWFRGALQYVNDSDKFLRALMPAPPSEEFPKGKKGYATDPDYFVLVRNVARTVERLGGPKWSGP